MSHGPVKDNSNYELATLVASRSTAVFIGVSDFEDTSLASIPYAVDDAVDLAHLFSLELQLIVPERLLLLLAGRPRKRSSIKYLDLLLEEGARLQDARVANLYQSVADASRSSSQGGIFIVSAATHGISEDGNDYVLATDSRREFLRQTGVSVSTLFDRAAAAGAKSRLLLIDTCRERLTKGRGADGEPMAKSFAETISDAHGLIVLSATTLGGFAYDDERRRNGVFTAAIIDGLRGGAPAEAAGWITVGKLADFAEKRVVSWLRHNRPYHPEDSFGIARRIEAGAESLPLSRNPEAMKELYQARRADALSKLRENQGDILLGRDWDRVASRLPVDGPALESEELLSEIEALDGTPRSHRILRDYLRSRPRRAFWPGMAKTRTLPQSGNYDSKAKEDGERKRNSATDPRLWHQGRTWLVLTILGLALLGSWAYHLNWWLNFTKSRNRQSAEGNSGSPVQQRPNSTQPHPQVPGPKLSPSPSSSPPPIDPSIENSSIKSDVDHRQLEEASKFPLFDGDPRKLPTLPDGKGGKILDLSTWPSGVTAISLEGCGGGGGGSGSGRARTGAGDRNQGPSGAGGAGSEWQSMVYYHLPADRRVKIRFKSDGKGGCGGGTAVRRDCAVPDHAKITDRAPDEGEPGHPGVTVFFGNLSFVGGDGGGTVPGWKWAQGPPDSEAPGGKRFVPGGRGGSYLGARMAGTSTKAFQGGAAGSFHQGSDGIGGGGGGASERGPGGDGGAAGTGSTLDAVGNMKPGSDGGTCAGGGGGGSAAGSNIGGANGGEGGPPYLRITIILPSGLPKKNAS